MKPLPLEQIGWNWESHKLALWWLGLLYRKPAQFNDNLDTIIQKQGYQKIIFSSVKLLYHFIPWMILFIIICR